ncbi:MAG: FAD-dependent oxidoreductase, partial [Bacteroidota bacterium]|nr:FAD-dependent oxidoreductase [Bacteroidota bacterium]
MDYKISIIGAGIIGLSIAAELSKLYKNIVVLEKNKKFGQETSSRNSEVIHSGIYYPKNSLKAKLCIEGRRKLYNFCQKHQIPFKKCGKYIVATNKEEEKKLKSILTNAVNNGVENAKMVNQKELKNVEPNVKAISAAFFAESGIVDSHSLMKTLETKSVNNGVDFAYNSEVIDINKFENGYKITVNDNNSDFSFTSEIVINAAGLFADKISALVGVKKAKYMQYFWKGEYFTVVNGKNKMVNSL